MELRHIRYFLAVASERNITRAAARLGIKQPPLSLQIKDLEDEVGAQLFHRVPKGIELTEAGEAFRLALEELPRRVEYALTAARRAARGEIGHLRVGTTSSAMFNAVVPSTIKSFVGLYPEVNLSLLESNTPVLANEVLEERLDVAFLRPGSRGSEALQFRPIAREPMIAVLPASHRYASARRISLAKLRDDKFVLGSEPAWPMLLPEILRACRRSGFEPRLGQSAPQLGSVINLVASGFGVSLVPQSVRQIDVKGVVYRDIAGPLPHAEIALAFRRGETSAAIRNFLRCASVALREVGTSRRRSPGQ